MRADVRVRGVAAHSARPWKGRNAIHDAGQVLARLTAYEPAVVAVDGLDYHEAMNATSIRGGIAGNVIPDECVVTVNYRYAPDKTPAEALEHVRVLFDGFEVVELDNAAGARPGLDLPSVQAFVEALGVPVLAKEGWTDVARFAALGIAAVNFGPGDPNLAHHDDERCPVSQLESTAAALLRWLG
jgi:succinyl-diaminopimelate desuccinylase